MVYKYTLYIESHILNTINIYIGRGNPTKFAPIPNPAP